MGEVQASNVHPRLDHLLQHIHRAGGWPCRNLVERKDLCLEVLFIQLYPEQLIKPFVLRKKIKVCIEQAWISMISMLNISVDQPMVQMMPVLRAVVGSESMSSRHMCSRKVSAMAALSCCVWMKAEPMSRDFGWGMAFVGATVGILQKKQKKKKGENKSSHRGQTWQLANNSFLQLTTSVRLSFTLK